MMLMASSRHPFALWKANLRGAEPSRATVLVRTVQQGEIVADTDWLTPWITEFGDKITQFLFTYTHDRLLAEDLAQEVFVRLIRFHQTHPHQAIHGGWLYTTARHVVIDAYRKAERHPEKRGADQENGVPQDPGFESTLTTRLAVQDTLDRLPRRDRECLWLFYYQEWSVPQIAVALHLSEMNVRTRLHRARKNFAALWGGDEYDPS
ncbi:MAG: hypothetical protein C7B46_06350 [Sulfobacillus benefaciens]|uniref:Sigma-70 family RNA polymerase sigma factor n=1 Tax=Sulfobacillus benefaciens TaxID=453960 RepID=A0A2T2XI70_9FIRM|nr:MAG: hypothetical protein C7B46_06350 [Sulfobacillus benefaciens]